MRNRLITIGKKILVFLLTFSLLSSSYLPIFKLAHTTNTVYAAGSCSSTQARVGGVALNQAATFLADMTEYTGAYYDSTNNRIVFIGRTNTAAPQFDKDDLAVAIRALFFNNVIPAVSLEKNATDSALTMPMDVKMYGGIEDTKFGQILLDADYKLKQYMQGYNASGSAVTSSVPSYSSVLNRYIALGPDHTKSNASRWWIEPDLVSLKYDDPTNSFVFDSVRMKVLTEQVNMGNAATWNQAAQDFADDQTNHFNDYAVETPEYFQVEQMAKVVAVVKWIHDTGIASDMSWARDYTPHYQATARQKPRLTTPFLDGGGGYSYNMSGGIQYDTSNSYTSDASTSANLKSASQAVNAPKEQIHWNFTQGGTTYDAVAVTADAFKSLGSYSTVDTDMTFPTSGDLSLNFTRSYSSFSDAQQGVGRGWSFLPAKLVDNKPQAGGILMSSCDAGDTFIKRNSLALEVNGEREAFDYDDTNLTACYYLPNDPSYHSTITPVAADSQKTLYHAKTKDQTDYTFQEVYADSQIIPRYELKLVSVEDKTGAKINYNYESSTSAKLTNISDDHSHSITMHYDGTNPTLISSISDWAGRTVSYTYDSQGNLLTVTDPRGNVTTYTYDGNNKLATIKDNENHTILSNTYTPEAKLDTQYNAASVSSSFSYDETNRIITATQSASPSKTTKIKYDSKGRILEDTDSLNNKFVYTYATESAPLTIKDKRNNTTTNIYDSKGNITSVTYPDSKTVTYTYNGHNKVTQISDGRYGGSPKISTFTYDGSDNLLIATESGRTTKYTYNSEGEILTKVNPLNHTTTYTRDSFGNKLTEVNPLSKTTTFAYDTIARLKQATDPNSKKSYLTYDNNGNILSASDSAGIISYLYDNDNRLTRTTLQNSTHTDYTYNNSSSLTSATDAGSNVTNYNYNSYQNQTSREDALNHTTTYEYDKMNRKTKRTTPLGKIIQWEYDAMGNITRRIDENNQNTDYTYDNMNRLSTITYPNSFVVTYHYDDRGNVTSIESSAGTTTFEYDAYDRLNSVTDENDQTISYNYDLADNLTQITYPNDQTVTYTYDNTERISTVTDWDDLTTTYHYNDNGTLASKDLPNGITSTYTYDNSNKVIGVSHTLGGNTLAQFTYVRNNLGDITYASESSTLSRRTTPTPTPTALPTPALVQSKKNGGGGGTTSLTTSFNSTPTAGNSVIVVVNSGGPNASTISVSDNHSNTYTRRGTRQSTSGGQNVEVFSADNINSSGTFTVTVTGDGGTLWGADILLLEVSGLDPNGSYQAEGTGSGTSTSPSTSSVTPNRNGAFILGVVSDKAHLATKTAGSGYTSIASENDLSTHNGYLAEDKVQGTAASTNATATLGSSANWAMKMSTFLMPSSAAASPSANVPWTAQYYNNTSLSGSPVLTRSEDTINHIWGTAAPAPGVNADGFSTRWTKTVTLPAGTYQFTTGTDDGDRVIVDGDTIINHWVDQGVTPYTANKTLSAGSHTIVVEYYENSGGAVARAHYQQISSLPSSQQTTFYYDVLGRLTGAVYPDTTLGYTYNTVGSLLTKTRDGSTISFTNNNDNQLTATSGASLTYDNKGNRITNGATNYYYNFDNKLASQSATGLNISYDYDSSGHRLSKTVNGNTTNYVNDLSGKMDRVLASTDPDGIDSYYIYGNGLVSQGYPYQAFREYYLDDGLGNIRYVTDDQGVNIQSYDYDPYGNSVQGGSVSTYAYKGEQPEDSGFNYLRARYYDPATGSFISRDPVDGQSTAPQTQNGYNYVSDNPINLADPLGLWTVDLNVNAGVGFAGVTDGLLVSNTGIYVYAGAGTASYGVAGAVLYTPDNPTTGMSVQGSVAAIVAVNRTHNYSDGSNSREIGLGGPAGGGAYTVQTNPLVCF